MGQKNEVGHEAEKYLLSPLAYGKWLGLVCSRQGNSDGWVEVRSVQGTGRVRRWPLR